MLHSETQTRTQVLFCVSPWNNNKRTTKNMQTTRKVALLCFWINECLYKKFATHHIFFGWHTDELMNRHIPITRCRETTTKKLIIFIIRDSIHMSFLFCMNTLNVWLKQAARTTSIQEQLPLSLRNYMEKQTYIKVVKH